MSRLDRRRLDRLIDAFAGVRLLVVGDLVLDEYVRGEVDRVSPEAPVPVVHVREETVVLGGAANAARNVVAMGGSVEVCSVIGDDRAGAHLTELLADLGVSPDGLIAVKGRPTTRKTRIVAQNQQIVRFDRETFDPPPTSATRALIASIDAALARVDGVILEDYGKGVLGKRVVATTLARAKALKVPVTVDPKASLSLYKGADLLKPNLREAEALTGIPARTDADLRRIATKLQRMIGGGDIVVTRGSEGMFLFEGKSKAIHVPTLPREVYDVQGAGDTAIAALALALRAGGSLHEAAVLANAASGIVVAKVGTATASAGELKAILPEALAAARSSSRGGRA